MSFAHRGKRARHGIIDLHSSHSLQNKLAKPSHLNTLKLERMALLTPKDSFLSTLSHPIYILGTTLSWIRHLVQVFPKKQGHLPPPLKSPISAYQPQPNLKRRNIIVRDEKYLVDSDISEGYIWILHSDIHDSRHSGGATRAFDQEASAPLIVRGDVDIEMASDEDEDDEGACMMMPNDSEIIEDR